MAQDTKPRPSVRPPNRPSARPDPIASLQRGAVDDVGPVLDALVSALARGQGQPESWSMLHELAVREERTSELAFAYERLAQDRKLKFLPTAVQCEILMHAATFLADVFGDLDGAATYLDQVLALQPAHAGAFSKLEAVLAARGNGPRLADLYATAALHRQNKDEQMQLLRRAAELADGFALDDERVLKIYQALLRIDPTDQAVRAALELRLRRAGKFRDLARLLEQTLSSSPDAPAEETLGIRERLIPIYLGELAEPSLALPHVEEILRVDPAHDLARVTAHRLIGYKPIAARAAIALVDAYTALGTFPEAAAMLEVSLENLRGTRRVEAQKRLGVLKQDKLGDAAAAHALFEAVVAADPSDDEARQRYRDLSRVLAKPLDAARLLSRVATGVREPAQRARLGTEIGEIYLEAGDTKRARAAFAGVVDAGGDDPALLRAARALARLHAESQELRPFAQVLELLSRIEPDETARSAAAEELAELAENELADKPRAITAWRALLGSPLHEQALASLERLYLATESYAELAEVLEQRAAISQSTSMARSFAVRAAELRSTHLNDRARATHAWLNVLASFGPSREVHARLIPLLEQEKRWDALAKVLLDDAEVAPEREMIPILQKLAQVRLTRLDDALGALEAYGRVFAIEPREPSTRQALEKLLAAAEARPPEVRLAVADLLEPVYRQEGDIAHLVRVLEVRAEDTKDPAARLAWLGEAAELSERELGDPQRALELAGRALAAAIDADLEQVTARLEEVDRLAAVSRNAARHAALLCEALSARPIDHPGLAELAKHAGKALVSIGDRGGALLLFRRALSFEPSSRELLDRIDGLLAEEGRPEERLGLYRAALAQTESRERRRELYHAIGTIERRDRGDPRAAIETWRAALAENPDDRAALESLLEAYEAAGDWGRLYHELLRVLPTAEAEQRARMLMQMAGASVKQGDPARAIAHYRELLQAGAASGELLTAMQDTAEGAGDTGALEEVLRKRVALASDPHEECVWVEKLALLQAERLGNAAEASASYRRAAAIAQNALVDEERARDLYERALAVSPSDRDAAEHLAELYARAEMWSKLPRVVRVLVETAADDGEAVRRLLELEPWVERAAGGETNEEGSEGIATWLWLADSLAVRGVRQTEIAFARTRVLASDPARADESAAAFRELLRTGSREEARVVQGFEAFLARAGGAPRDDDRRFLLAWKAEHAPETERVGALLAWAAAEQSTFRDPAAALAVYRRVLALEPELVEALRASARLSLELGDGEGAFGLLGALLDLSEGTSRRECELEIAELLLGKLDRGSEALDRVAPLLEAVPTDEAALALVFRALEQPALREKAATLLERSARAAEDREQALAILKVLLATPRDQALEAARRRWFQSLLDLYEPEHEVALETALAALLEWPDEDALWARAEKLARALGQPKAVAQTYRRVLEQSLDPEVAGRIARRAVDYEEEWFDEPAAVLELLRRSLEISPDAAWARDRLKLAYGSTERWDDLFALYDSAIARAESDADRAEWLAEAGQTAKDLAGDADRAIVYFERLLKVRPGEARVKSLLERLYEKQGRIGPLIELLSAELGSLAGELGQRMRLRIARLWLREEHEGKAAFRLVEEVLASEPERADAFTLLEELVFRDALPRPEHGGPLTPVPRDAASDAAINSEPGDESVPPSSPPARPDSPGSEQPTVLSDSLSASRTPPPRTSSFPPSAGVLAGAYASSIVKSRRKKRAPSVRQRAATMLKARYIAQGKGEDLARVLDIELSLAASPKDRVRLHQDLLALCLEQLADDTRAFEHAAALVSLEPRVANHRLLLEKLAERLSLWDRLGQVLVAVAGASSDAALTTELLTHAAEIYRDRVGKDERAIDLFAAVLALPPKDKSVALATARKLDSLLERHGRAKERCAVLEKIAALESEPQARLTTLAELARVAAFEVNDPDRAIAAWRGYLDEGNDDAPAWNGLVDVLRTAARWTELCAALEHRALRQSSRARPDRIEIAQVFGDKIGDHDRAVEAWRRVRTELGTGDDTFLPLSALLESLARWDELAALVVEDLTELAASARSDTAAPRLFEQRARVERMGQHLSQRALRVHVCHQLFSAGVACWISPLADDPKSERAASWAAATWWALEELIRMAIEEGNYEGAALHMLEGSALVFELPRARRLRREAARIFAERLHRPERAIAVYGELLREDSGDALAEGIVPELARLFEQTGAYPSLTELWEQEAERLERAGQSKRVSEHWARAAELSEKRLGDTARALADYQKSARAGGGFAFREIARLYRERGHHLAAAGALEELSRAAPEETLVSDTLAMIDALVAGGERAEARTRLEAALTGASAPRPLRARLRELYREEQSFDKLADLLKIEADLADDRATRLALLCEAADIHLHQRHDPAAAAPLLEQARKLDPDDSALGLTLARALSAAARHEEAASALRAELERYGTRRPKERALVHFELSRVALHLGERARALAELDMAGKIDPAQPTILYDLGKLAAEEGQLERAQRTFRALLLLLGRSDPAAPFVVSRGEVLFELAAIAEKENDPERALELVDSALHAASEDEREAKSFELALGRRGRRDLLARSLEIRLAAAASDSGARVTILRKLTETYRADGGPTSDQKERLAIQADHALALLKKGPAPSFAALGDLAELFGLLERPDSQAEALVEQIAAGEGPPPAPGLADALCRLADICLGRPDVREQGALLLERALDCGIEPERAAELLRKATVAAPKSERLVRLLDRVSRGPGQEKLRAEALGRLIDLDLATKSDVLEAIALARGACDDALAESILAKVVSSGPELDEAEAVAAKVALAELYARRGDQLRAAELKEDAAAHAGAEQRRALLLDVAAAAAGPLDDCERAARIYVALRAQDPADRRVWEALLEIYRRLGHTEQLTLLIAETLPLIESRAERSRLRLEQATALLGDPVTEEQATRVLEELVDEDPSQVEAGLMLFGILEKRGLSAPLTALLQKQLDAAKDRADVGTIVSLSMRLGSMLEDAGRAADALAVYQASLDWDDKSQMPLRAIVRLSEGRGEGVDIADALEKLLAVESGRGAAEVALRLFAIRSEQDELALADRALEAGLRADPNSRDLLELLVRRHGSRGAYRELAGFLGQVFERAPDNHGLLGALLEANDKIGELAASVTGITLALEKSPSAAALYRERAVRHEAMGNSEAALRDFEHAYSFGGIPFLDDFVRALEREAVRLEPPADRPIKLELSRVLSSTGFADGARAHLSELLKRDAKDEAALRGLAALEMEAERWDAASAAWRRLLPLEQGAELVEVALKLADACEKAGRAADARSGLERAVKAMPAHAVARARLRELYEKTGAGGPLARLMLEDAESEGNVSGRFDLLLKAAKLLLGQEGDPAQAVQVLEQARSLRPEDDEGILLSARAYAANEKDADALALLHAAVAQRKGRRSKQLASMHREIAHIHQKGGHKMGALDAMIKSFDMDLHNGEVALELGLLARELDQQEVAARAFRSVTFMKQVPPGNYEGATATARGLSYFYLGQMAKDKGDYKKARLMAQKAVIEDPTLDDARTLLDELKTA